MYQASNPLRATRGDMAVREDDPVAPTDLPAPGQAVAVPQAGTATASTLAAWILDHARTDFLRGRPVPDEVAAHVRDLLNPPMSAHGPNSGPTETIEITTAEMARRMGCTARHVRRLIPEGSLRARRAGHVWLITVEEEHQDDHAGRDR